MSGFAKRSYMYMHPIFQLQGDVTQLVVTVLKFCRKTSATIIKLIWVKISTKL